MVADAAGNERGRQVGSDLGLFFLNRVIKEGMAAAMKVYTRALHAKIKELHQAPLLLKVLAQQPPKALKLSNR